MNNSISAIIIAVIVAVVLIIHIMKNNEERVAYKKHLERQEKEREREEVDSLTRQAAEEAFDLEEWYSWAEGAEEEMHGEMREESWAREQAQDAKPPSVARPM